MWGEIIALRLDGWTRFASEKEKEKIDSEDIRILELLMTHHLYIVDVDLGHI